MRARSWAGLLCLIILVGFATTHATDYRYKLSAKEVVPGVYLVRGSTAHFSIANGGNIANAAFVVTDVGVVVIDTGPSRRYGEALRRLIETTTSAPLRIVFNTHHHPDHFFGNGAFGDLPILALPETIDLMKEQGPAFTDNLYRLLGPWMTGTELYLPNTAVNPGDYHVGKHRFELAALNGHTAGDLVIIDRENDVLFCGDICFNGRAPTTPNADLDAWQTSLRLIEAMKPALIVPGHGDPFTGSGPLREVREYLSWLDSRIDRAVYGGEDMGETMYKDTPRRFSQFDTLDEEYRRSVMHLYPPREEAMFRNDESDTAASVLR